MFTITEMDHIVLNVQDTDKILDFYTRVLGLKPERVEAFRQGQVPFPSVRLNADTIIDLFPTATGSGAASEVRSKDLNHFCMVIEKTDMQQVIAHLEGHGVRIEQGPVTRWGARGNATSIYFYDPEQHQIELRYYDA
ncbi:Virulence protein [Candidatus Entotheonellaceae bacterium PAL068K]